MALLSVRDLTTHFDHRGRVVRAVEGVFFELQAGETLGVVGESGSGKSVACASLLGLIPRPPGQIIRGEAWFDGVDLLRAPRRVLQGIRGNRIGMVFQDPMTALNPYLTIGTQLIEPLRRHRRMGRRAARVRAIAALEAVGIPDAPRRIDDYPHAFSGGMRQRVLIAMAMITEPALLIADEPTTALDVTVQAQILELLQRLQTEHGTAILLVTHDLGVAAGFCDRVHVMYAGRILESAPTERLFEAPAHPYTVLLQRAHPALQPRDRPLVTLPGQPPDLSEALPGDPFAGRIPEIAQGDGRDMDPTPRRIAPGHWAAASTIPLEWAKQSRPPFPGPELAGVGGAPGARSSTGARPEPRDRRTESGSATVNPGARGDTAPAIPRRHPAGASTPDPLLVLDEITVHFRATRGGRLRPRRTNVRAVDGVSLQVASGEILGLVGESGCGKTTLARTILQLIRPTRGRIRLAGRELSGLRGARLRAARRPIQMVFQDPHASLNPRLTVYEALAEAARTRHPGLKGSALRAAVAEQLHRVGLAAEAMGHYPHEFSGGQRQRIAIARALAPEPLLLLADEPVSALDGSIQGQILNLLRGLAQELGLTLIFISHDLAVVRYLSDRVAVMYLGQLVELGDTEAVMADPRHPYTRALMSAVPIPDPARERQRQRIVLPGDPPSPIDPPPGCRFAPRCPQRGDRLAPSTEPPFAEIRPGHWVSGCSMCVS
jgi:peptide/nickel transport system ATP-binding protein